MQKIQSTTVIVLLLWCVITIAGCSSGGSDSGAAWYGDSGGTSATVPQITTVNNMDLPGQPIRVGDWIQLQGSGFGTTRIGTSSDGYVVFSDGATVSKATNYGRWNDTIVECQVPQGAPIKAFISKESVSILIVKPDTTGGGSSYNSNANPTPNPSPQSTPPSPTPSLSPSVSPTPTPSPSPSPTPTPSPVYGGMGGGGTTPTLVSVNVTPENAVIAHRKAPSAIGQDDGGNATQQFTAKAVYSNGNEVDVTTQCSWSTTSTTGAVGNTTGLFTADNNDSTKKFIEQSDVKAVYGGKEVTVKITVGLVEVPGITPDPDGNAAMVNLRLGDIYAPIAYNDRILIQQIDAFYAGQYEVTNKEFCEFLNEVSEGEPAGKNPVEDGASWWDSTSGGDPVNNAIYNGIEIVGGNFQPKDGYSARPVVYVSWYAVVAYCNWLSEKHGLAPCYGVYKADGTERWGNEGANYNPANNGYRLFTEAEWEYACRNNGTVGGVSTEYYYWGPVLSFVDPPATGWEYLWFFLNSNPDPPNTGSNHQIVGTKLPNGLGLYDMSGNVWEWVSDWSGGDYPKNGWGDDTKNPKGPKTGTLRLVRGGSWDGNNSFVRSGYRYRFGSPSECNNSFGFRLMRTR